MVTMMRECRGRSQAQGKPLAQDRRLNKNGALCVSGALGSLAGKAGRQARCAPDTVINRVSPIHENSSPMESGHGSK